MRKQQIKIRCLCPSVITSFPKIWKHQLNIYFQSVTPARVRILLWHYDWGTHHCRLHPGQHATLISLPHPLVRAGGGTTKSWRYYALLSIKETITCCFRISHVPTTSSLTSSIPAIKTLLGSEIRKMSLKAILIISTFAVAFGYENVEEYSSDQVAYQASDNDNSFWGSRCSLGEN